MKYILYLEMKVYYFKMKIANIYKSSNESVEGTSNIICGSVANMGKVKGIAKST